MCLPVGLSYLAACGTLHSIQVRTNASKVGWDSDSYYAYNVPDTESQTENNCKSATDCPGDENDRDFAPWTAVRVNRDYKGLFRSPVKRGNSKREPAPKRIDHFTVGAKRESRPLSRLLVLLVP